MGCFDTIIFQCTCGQEINAQTKSGPCLLDNYHLDSVPIDVARDANRHAPFHCDCGKKWLFKDESLPEETRIKMEVIEV